MLLNHRPVNPESPPIAAPHSAPAPQRPTIRRAKGIAFLLLAVAGCIAFAVGFVMLVTTLGGGMGPLFGHNVEWDEVLGAIFAAILGAVLCWGGYHLLRLAFGNRG